MAKNIVLEPGFVQSVAASHPATPVSGAPVRLGRMTGLALTAEGGGGNAATHTTVHFGPFVAQVSVKGIDGSGSSAVAAGDKIYYVDADTPPLSKVATGYFFGYALEPVGGNATATIKVAHPAFAG